MKSTVVVPTYNGKKRILNLLRSMQNQSQLPDEIIVVVDGSTDNTIKAIENENFNDLPLVVHVQENKGRPAARNTGLKLANHDLIISFDDDMVLTPHVIELHVKHHQKHPDSVCIGYQAEKKPEINTPNYHFLDFRYHLSQKWHKASPHYPKSMEMHNYQLTTANCSFPKKIIKEVGAFDENLKEVEDFDLGTRIMKKGFLMFYNPDILAWHDNPDWDFKKFVQRQVQYRADDLSFVKKLEVEGSLDERLKKHPRFRADTKYNFLKSSIINFLANPTWISMAEKKPFTMLPKTFRYRFMDVVATAFTYKRKRPE